MNNYNLTVPSSLRKKYVSSEISRQIFFIDCINDLFFCANQNSSYHLIRSSVPLRILLLDGGLETILGDQFNDVILFAYENEISGNALTKSETRNIKKIMSLFSEKQRDTNFIYLSHAPLKPHSISEFISKICLQINTSKEYNFSVQNIIEIIANKHGGAHIEKEFDSLTIESFMMGNFSPYSMKDGNFFLEKIKEILIILTSGITPFCLKIIENLEDYNSRNEQAENSNFAYVMAYEDLEKQKK